MIAMLTNYDDFVTRVDSLGFMTLSDLLTGLPSLGNETTESLWHTGLDTDPWRWKDRAADEKRLAYGCMLGGHKGFVAQRMYPIFFAAFHPTLSMPERWSSGTINQITWQLWQLFEGRGQVSVLAVIQFGQQPAEILQFTGGREPVLGIGIPEKSRDGGIILLLQ